MLFVFLWKQQKTLSSNAMQSFPFLIYFIIQKCVRGYKKGFGIFCLCCQSEVRLLLLELLNILIEVFTLLPCMSRSALHNLKHMLVGLLVASRECCFEFLEGFVNTLLSFFIVTHFYCDHFFAVTYTSIHQMECLSMSCL